MAHYELAQLNLASLAYPLDSPELKGFVDNLDLINSLAERSEGFVWRLQTPAGDATGIDYFGKDIIVNMSTWRDVPSLKHFVYKTVHVQFLKRRAEWFSEMKTYSVLWWIPQGIRPTVEQAHEKLQLLEAIGPTEAAFSLIQPFAPPGNSKI